MNAGSIVEGTVLEAGEDTAKLLVDGGEVRFQTPQQLSEGSVLKLRVRDPTGTPSFEVQFVADTTTNTEALTSLRNTLGIDSGSETLSRLENVIAQNSDRSSGEVLDRIT